MVGGGSGALTNRSLACGPACRLAFDGMEVTVVLPIGVEIQATLTTLAVSANGEIRLGLTTNIFDDLDTDMWRPR